MPKNLVTRTFDRALLLTVALTALGPLGPLTPHVALPRAQARGKRPAPLIPQVLLTQDLSSRFTPPTFSKVRPVQLMDGGKLLYYGKGVLGEQN